MFSHFDKSQTSGLVDKVESTSSFHYSSPNRLHCLAILNSITPTRINVRLHDSHHRHHILFTKTLDPLR